MTLPSGQSATATTRFRDRTTSSSFGATDSVRQSFSESRTVVSSDGRVSYDAARGRSSVRTTQAGSIAAVTRSDAVFFSSRRPDGPRSAGTTVVPRDGVMVAADRRLGSPRTTPGRSGPTVDGFYGRYLDRRIEYPGVPVPRSAALRVGVIAYRPRPSYVCGRRVIVGVSSCGFGFLTPVYPAYPVYPVYPVPLYSSTTFITPPPYVVDGGYYADGSYYADGGYVDTGPPPGYTRAPYATNPGYAEVPPADVAGPAPAAAPQAPVAPPAEAPSAPSEEPAPITQTPGEPPAPDEPQQELTREQQQMRDGLRAFAAGEYDQAGRTFLQVALGDNNNIDAWLAYAVARFATRDYEASALAIRRGIRAMPDVVNSPVDIRQRYGQAGDFDAHLAALEEHLRHKPEKADAWLVLGFVRHFTGQRELAAKTFEVIQRRFEADKDLAKAFLEAKSPEEIQRELSRPNGEGPASHGAAPRDALEGALQAEQNLRDAGLTEPSTE